MAAFVFPSSPSVGDVAYDNGVAYQWNGTGWVVYKPVFSLTYPASAIDCGLSNGADTVFTFSATTPSVLNVASGGTGLSSLTAGYIPFGSGTNAFGSTSNLFWDNTNARLGIGTASPSYPVSVVSGSQPQLTIQDNFTNSTTKTAMLGCGHYLNAQAPAACFYAYSTSTDNGLNIGGAATQMNASTLITFNTAANNTTAIGSERMRITAAGDVGINCTPNASYKLDVNGAARFVATTVSDNAIEINTTGTGNRFAFIDFHGDDTYTDYGLRIIRNDAGANTNSDIVHRGTGVLYINAFDAGSVAINTSNTERMRIDSLGNVGIGAAPSAKVHVESVGDTALRMVKTNQSDWIFQTIDTGVIRLYSNTAAAERMRIDSAGCVIIGNTTAYGSEALQLTRPVSGYISRWYNTHGSNPHGLILVYSGAAPNGVGNPFIYCIDSGAERFIVRSNGGIANYQANDVNLSDERTKTDISLAGNYLEKICAIPVKTFKYKDQTHDDLNLGVIAQDVEAVAPELVDTDGFGDTPPDGIPLKTIYQTDLQFALMRSIQELAAEVAALKEQING